MRHALLAPRRTNDLASFIEELLEVSPDLRLLWVPRPADTTTTVSQGRTFTYDATIAGRITTQGEGIVVTFDGTSNDCDTPDTPDMSFGDATNDDPCSGVVLAKPTNQASQRGLFGKYGTGASGNREYLLALDSGEKLKMFLYDASVDAQPVRTAMQPVATGSFQALGWSYNGVGGATAADGMIMTVNGVEVLSTAANDVNYVAMEDKSALVNIGGGQSTGGGAGADEFFAGDIGFVVVYAVYLSPNQHLQIKQAVNRFYGLTL